MLVRITALALVLADAPLPAPVEVPQPPVVVPGVSPPADPPREQSEPSDDEPKDTSAPTGEGEATGEGEPTGAGEPTGEGEATGEGEPTGADAPADDDPFGDDADQEPWPEGDGEGSDAEPLPDYDPLRDSPQALRARHWVRLGIGTLSAGGALLIGSIVMAASDPCNRKAGNSCQPEARRRAALVMGIPAGALLAGGAAMLGVGLARQHRLAIDLQAGRTSVGLTVRGRF